MSHDRIKGMFAINTPIVIRYRNWRVQDALSKDDGSFSLDIMWFRTKKYDGFVKFGTSFKQRGKN
jgi:hypothetical protein